MIPFPFPEEVLTDPFLCRSCANGHRFSEFLYAAAVTSSEDVQGGPWALE